MTPIGSYHFHHKQKCASKNLSLTKKAAHRDATTFLGPQNRLTSRVAIRPVLGWTVWF